jgi:hypothetical protein
MLRIALILNIIRFSLKSKKIKGKSINDYLLCFNNEKYMYFIDIFNLNEVLYSEGFT